VKCVWLSESHGPEHNARNGQARKHSVEDSKRRSKKRYRRAAQSGGLRAEEASPSAVIPSALPSSVQAPPPISRWKRGLLLFPRRLAAASSPAVPAIAAPPPPVPLRCWRRSPCPAAGLIAGGPGSAAFSLRVRVGSLLAIGRHLHRIADQGRDDARTMGAIAIASSAPNKPQTPPPLEFEEQPTYGSVRETLQRLRDGGMNCYFGRWLIPGRPRVILLDYRSRYNTLNATNT